MFERGEKRINPCFKPMDGTVQVRQWQYNESAGV